jgi:hypothetical protein
MASTGNRLKRLAVQWGGLALVLQLWVALGFVHYIKLEWETARPKLVSFKDTMDRMSQMKSVVFKYPYIAIYIIAAALLIGGVIAYLTIRGVREAMAPEPDDRAPPL